MTDEDWKRLADALKMTQEQDSIWITVLSMEVCLISIFLHHFSLITNLSDQSAHGIFFSFTTNLPTKSAEDLSEGIICMGHLVGLWFSVFISRLDTPPFYKCMCAIMFLQIKKLKKANQGLVKFKTYGYEAG